MSAEIGSRKWAFAGGVIAALIGDCHTAASHADQGFAPAEPHAAPIGSGELNALISGCGGDITSRHYKTFLGAVDELYWEEKRNESWAGPMDAILERTLSSHEAVARSSGACQASLCRYELEYSQEDDGGVPMLIHKALDGRARSFYTGMGKSGTLYLLSLESPDYAMKLMQRYSGLCASKEKMNEGENAGENQAKMDRSK